MSSLRRATALALTAAALHGPAPAWADCATIRAEARCPSVPVRPIRAGSAISAVPVPARGVEVGDVLARGVHSILLNAGYYGLPPVADGWVYVRVGRDVFRMDWRSHEVLERVTHEAAANF